MLFISYSMCRNFRRTLKYSSNLTVYLLFFFIFCCVKKRRNRCGIFFFLIAQPFLYLEDALKLISQEQFKNTTTKIFQVRQQFRGLSKISTHRIWDGKHIKRKKRGKFSKCKSKQPVLYICFLNIERLNYGNLLLIGNWRSWSVVLLKLNEVI